MLSKQFLVCSVSSSFSDITCLSLHEVTTSDNENRINIFFIQVIFLYETIYKELDIEYALYILNL